MFYVIAGSVDYYYKNASSAETIADTVFLCEGVLWLQWLHRGRTVAVESTELAVVCASRFRAALRRNVQMFACAQHYARSFAAHYVAQYQAGKRISDLPTSAEREEAWEMAYEAFS